MQQLTDDNNLTKMKKVTEEVRAAIETEKAEEQKFADLIPDVHQWRQKVSMHDLRIYYEYVKEDIAKLYGDEMSLDAKLNLAKQYYPARINRYIHKEYNGRGAKDSKEWRDWEDNMMNLDVNVFAGEIKRLDREDGAFKKMIADETRKFIKSQNEEATIVSKADEYHKVTGAGGSVTIYDNATGSAGRLANEVLFDGSSKNWLSSERKQKDAAWNYTFGSGHLNIPMQGRKFEGKIKQTLQEFKDEAAVLTEYIDKEELPHDMLLLRQDKDLSAIEGRLRFAGEDMPDDIQRLIGKEVQDPGFMSTTCSLALGISKEKTVTMFVYAPKGTKAAYVEPYSYYGKGGEINYATSRAPGGRYWDGHRQMKTVSDEDEAILQRGTIYRIE